jgi:hypothetical protein
MNTRSQSKRPLYEVNIDFDEASEAWKKNKKSIGNGQYNYICSALIKHSETQCSRVCSNGLMFCKQHSKTLSKFT